MNRFELLGKHIFSFCKIFQYITNIWVGIPIEFILANASENKNNMAKHNYISTRRYMDDVRRCRLVTSNGRAVGLLRDRFICACVVCVYFRGRCAESAFNRNMILVCTASVGAPHPHLMHRANNRTPDAMIIFLFYIPMHLAVRCFLLWLNIPLYLLFCLHTLKDASIFG